MTDNKAWRYTIDNNKYLEVGKRIAPSVGIQDEPTRCFIVNEEWCKIVAGAMSELLNTQAWQGLPGENSSIIQSIITVLIGEDCTMNCNDVIACLSSDATYIELVSSQYSSIEYETNQYRQELVNQYDNTPQSVGANVPTSPPTQTQQQALCYTLEKWVTLYAEQKIAKINQKNKIQILINNVKSAAENLYDRIDNRLAFLPLPDLFGCVVDDDIALSVLGNVSIREQVSCCLYTELKNKTISYAEFSQALVNCQSSQTGQVLDFLCMLDNDTDVPEVLSFFEAYSINLDRQNQGATLSCSCMAGEYPSLVIGRCSDTFVAGTVQQISTDTWRVTAEFKGAPNPPANYAVFHDVQNRRLDVASVTRISAIGVSQARFYDNNCNFSTNLSSPANYVGRNDVYDIYLANDDTSELFVYDFVFNTV